MPVAYTVIATLFLGVLGFIVAIMGANSCARAGQNGAKHIGAFFITLMVWVGLLAAIIFGSQ